ncbi:MAG: glycosyltransferase family 4 protein [Gammaproteobacteria bacterium]
MKLSETREKLKIVYITRLFSGLMASVKQQNWQPSGVPTIYKMIEALAERHEAGFLFLPKGGYEQKALERINFPQIDSAFYVLPSEHVIPKYWGRKAAYLLRELLQFYYVVKIVRREKPDLIYVDHANVLIAAFYARMYRNLPVIFRLMGCFGVRSSFEAKTLMARLFRWGYRSPFAAVICTQEGSNVDYWLNRALDASVPRYVLLNGVDEAKAIPPDSRIQALPKDKTKVLMIGRLDPDKSAREFLSAFLTAWRRDPQRLHAVIIGTGSLQASMLDEVRQAGAEQAVTFIDQLAHAQIAVVHQHTDIYVSLNRAGNLSNANLEAMRAGQCMIIPRSQDDTGIDKIIDTLLSDRAVYRVPQADDVAAIAAAIYTLHAHPDMRAALSERLTEESSKFLFSWEERIRQEMRLLEGAAEGVDAEPIKVAN